VASKVLVVEDDAFLLRAYQFKLEKSGFEVKTANNGEDALTALKTFPAEVVLLDLVMPRKDGFATLQEIRQQERLKDLPVFVISNLGQKEEIDRVMSMGATDCLIKSNLSMEDLVKRIQAV
jgi:DNA-binding response OmpR family regulator